MGWPSLLKTAIQVSSGILSSAICLPTAALPGKTFSLTSDSQASFSCFAAISGWASRGMSRPRRRARKGMVEPCTRTEAKTTKNTTLKIISAFPTPDMRGNVARMMGTEPRRPTQEIKTLSLRDICRKGKRHKRTLMGRAMNMRTKQMNRAMPATGINREG